MRLASDIPPAEISSSSSFVMFACSWSQTRKRSSGARFAHSSKSSIGT